MLSRRATGCRCRITARNWGGGEDGDHSSGLCASPILRLASISRDNCCLLAPFCPSRRRLSLRSHIVTASQTSDCLSIGGNGQPSRGNKTRGQEMRNSRPVEAVERVALSQLSPPIHEVSHAGTPCERHFRNQSSLIGGAAGQQISEIGGQDHYWPTAATRAGG